MAATRSTQFLGGSPVSSAGNPYDDADSLANDSTDILPSLDIEGYEASQLAQLDAYGSNPVTNDSAAERPMNPPTIGGDDANGS